MISFQPITPDDKALVTSYTLPGSYRDNNLSICNLCSWQFLHQSSYTVLNGQMVIRFRFQEGTAIYTLPFGPGDTAATLLSLYETARETGEPFRFYGANPYFREQLEKYFPHPFSYECSRDHFDYIYLHTALTDLPGRDYQPKRNHINKFRKKYDYRYVALTPDLLPHCLELADKWCKHHNCEDDENLQDEQQAMRFAMDNFTKLGLRGGALQVEGEIVAFTYGAPVNHDTFCVHIEKADTHFEGAYATINQEFARQIPEEFLYINREEDLGLAGLRKAKLSYYPAFLLEKCRATLRKG